MSGEPARGYSWPSFAEGNFAAARHGARSPRLVAPLAAGVEAAVAEVAPWTSRPTFAPAVRSYAWVEAQLELVRQWLDRVGVLDDEGQPRPAVAYLDRLEGRAGKLRAELGLTPLALAKLLGSLATTAATVGDDDALASLRAEGARIIEARAPSAGGEP